MRVYRIEQGEVPTRLGLLEEIADAFGMRLLDVLEPLLDPTDPTSIARAKAERLEADRAAREQHELDRYVESVERPAYRRWMQVALKSGVTMTDQELELLHALLALWNQNIGQLRYVDVGVRERMSRRLAKNRRKK